MRLVLGQHLEVGLDGHLELRDVEHGGDERALHVDVQRRRAVQAGGDVHLRRERGLIQGVTKITFILSCHKPRIKAYKYQYLK